jgi:predicted metal-dependent peptidase
MEKTFHSQVAELRQKVARLLRIFSDPTINTTKFKISMPEGFEQEFFQLIDKVNFALLEEKDNFYGYFLFQMEREISFRISSPAATNFKKAKYTIYFNPFIFLNLTLEQMKSTIKHEILHILSLHLLRAKKMQEQYNQTIINMAMDIVVNKYLTHLPPYFNTLELVNKAYSLNLKPYETFEYYAQELNKVEVLQNKDLDKPNKDTEYYKDEFDISSTHDIWKESDDTDERTLTLFTEKAVQASKKEELPLYLEGILAILQKNPSELPWNHYLSHMMGTFESDKKKTITRRNRRQPERLELRGYLRSHKVRILVALDISGSVNAEEFKHALTELFSIVKNYGHEITVVECDDEIRQVYRIKSEKEIKNRSSSSGSTKFSPVFEYANHKVVNLLIYFTDGKGEKHLKVKPKGYRVLWVLSGKGDKLSLLEPYGPVKKLNYAVVEDTILDINDVERGGYSMHNQESL